MFSGTCPCAENYLQTENGHVPVNMCIDEMVHSLLKLCYKYKQSLLNLPIITDKCILKLLRGYKKLKCKGKSDQYDSNRFTITVNSTNTKMRKKSYIIYIIQQCQYGLHAMITKVKHRHTVKSKVQQQLQLWITNRKRIFTFTLGRFSSQDL